MVNQVVQDFNHKHFKALKSFKVKSRQNRNPDTSEFEEYTVELMGNGNIYCNCMWGQKGNKKVVCWHINEIREGLENQYGSIDQAIKHYRDNQ